MIEARNIKKTYGSKTILSGITFSAVQGQCVGIIGINGSGKSTLLSILAGVLKSDSGTIRYNQEDAIQKRGVFSKYTGYVPQDNPLIEELTVKDNLLLWYAHSRKNLEEALKTGFPAQFGLAQIQKMPVKKLSGGMKKRLSIACAFVNVPPILILDEPSAALDLVYKKEIHDFIKSYLSQGGTVIITTHDEADLSLCNKLYILKDGVLNEVSPHLRKDELIHKLS